MKILFYSTKPYEEEFFTTINTKYHHTLSFYNQTLTLKTLHHAEGYNAVCVSVRDTIDNTILKSLKKLDITTLALRSAGYDHVDVKTAKKMGFSIVYVPYYSPYAIAEHSIMLMLGLNRNIKESIKRTNTYNFSLDGLLGFDMHQKTVGIIGTGKIGLITAKILQGFGCKVIAFDIFENPECKNLNIPYVSLDALFSSSDIISLHCPLTPETKYIINAQTIKKMKDGVMIINTARGELIDTNAVITSLQSGKINYLGLDVYEKEKGVFFEDKSEEGIEDKNLKTLLSLPNTLITSHQASFTKEAKLNIANSILESMKYLEEGKKIKNILE